MRPGPSLTVLLLTALCLGALSAAWGADRPLLLMELPTDGPVSPAVKAAYTALQPQYDIWWLKVHEPAQHERPPAALVVGTGSKLLKESKLDFGEFVRNGGGLVFVATMSRDERDANNEFLRRFEVRIGPIQGPGQEFRLLPHAVTGDITDLPARTTRGALVADTLEPIALLDSSPVAVAGTVGKGRVVVLAQPLVAMDDASRAPGSPQARLLAQAIAWAAGQGLAPPSGGIGAGQAATEPPAAADLTQKAVVDLPETELWQGVVGVLGRQLGAVGLPVEPLRYEKNTHTLAEVLLGRPALVVLGSYRDFDEAETAALADYVSFGGSLLALGFDDGAKSPAKRVSALNRALGEFGISFTLGRPAGQGVLRRHPITEGMRQPGRVAAGGAVWAFAAWPLATVGEEVVASAHEFREGRIVVLDASTLLPPGPKEQPNSSEWFQGLLVNAVRWLTGK